MRTVISEGVKEIWLSSEDTGAYGCFSNLYFLIFSSCDIILYFLFGGS